MFVLVCWLATCEKIQAAGEIRFSDFSASVMEGITFQALV